MASPKRAWPPDRDSDGETAAAFEAAVAVVKASVARSGEVLSTAKEDLAQAQAQQQTLEAQKAALEDLQAQADENKQIIQDGEQKIPPTADEAGSREIGASPSSA